MDKIKRMKELIHDLNKASKAYYTGEPIMSDYDWDRKYEELSQLEKELDIVLNDSPTLHVGYKVSKELKEVRHNHSMLSLDKTKNVNELKQFAGNKNCFLSVKCDGLTLSLYYKNGKLIAAETRGDGENGISVLENALTIRNIPQTIPYKDELIIDGETIIGWETFRQINEELPADKKYKHPRNLVSGSLQLLDSYEASKRNMRFIAWRVIKGFYHKSVSLDLKEAERNGFEVVPMITYSNNTENNLSKQLEQLRTMADEHNIPYDGAVMAVDDYNAAEAMGRTDKFFRHSMAYKYEDELFETVLRDIEWNTSKTGLINPVAVFDPVDMNGAVTTRATLHNITYIKDMMLGIGDRIRVYRSNMVIPKVHDSIDKSGNFDIPDKCPVCGEPTKIIKENDSEVLWCTSPECKGKLLGKLTHAVSRNALNIDGLSEATIQKFISLGWLNSIQDIYYLNTHEKQMKTLDGFGSKSVSKLFQSIEKSRNTTLDRFLYALSIPLVGKTASKAIAEAEDYQFESFMRDMTHPGAKFFSHIPGIGDSIINSLDEYFNRECSNVWELGKEFTFETPKKVFLSINSGKDLTGQTFVITGSLKHFENRDAFKEKIESLGGKVSGSISKKVTALINNDVNSTSSKNTKAKSIGVKIMSEDEFLEYIS